MSVELRPPSPTPSMERDHSGGDEFEAGSSGPERVNNLNNLSSLFTLPNGDPARFFLHKSLTQTQRHTCTEKITTHGGAMTSIEKNAKIILVSQGRLGTTSLETLRLGWEVHPNPAFRDIRVENIVFLTQCVNNRRFLLNDAVKVKQRISGRPGMTEPCV